MGATSGAHLVSLSQWEFNHAAVWGSNKEKLEVLFTKRPPLDVCLPLDHAWLHI